MVFGKDDPHKLFPKLVLRNFVVHREIALVLHEMSCDASVGEGRIHKPSIPSRVWPGSVAEIACALAQSVE